MVSITKPNGFAAPSSPISKEDAKQEIPQADAIRAEALDLLDLVKAPELANPFIDILDGKLPEDESPTAPSEVPASPWENGLFDGDMKPDGAGVIFKIDNSGKVTVGVGLIKDGAPGMGGPGIEIDDGKVKPTIVGIGVPKPSDPATKPGTGVPPAKDAPPPPPKEQKTETKRDGGKDDPYAVCKETKTLPGTDELPPPSVVSPAIREFNARLEMHRGHWKPAQGSTTKDASPTSNPDPNDPGALEAPPPHLIGQGVADPAGDEASPRRGAKAKAVLARAAAGPAHGGAEVINPAPNDGQTYEPIKPKKGPPPLS